MDENIQTIKKLIFRLRKEFGNIISIEEVINLGIEENISEKDVMKAIKALEDEGIINIIDKETIDVNA